MTGSVWEKGAWLLLVTVVLALAPLGGTTTAFAQDAEAPTVAETTETAAEETAEIDYSDLRWEMGWTINTLIMFICAVLVIFMQAGFAMLEVGLNSAKNTVNILFKNVMDLAVGVLLYLFIGWGIMYSGTDSPYFGYDGPWVTRDAQMADDGSWDVAPNDSDGAPYASSAVDFLFQVAFAATAATIVSGAVAGRMQFKAYLIYSAILTGLVYPISGFWKWGGGFLDQMGFQDFAGSIVVHAVGGFAGLAGAIVLGPRLGRYVNGKSVPMPGHNIAFAALGVFILWVGWYGFNPGSQLTYDGFANAEATTYIALTTTIAAAGGAVSAMFFAWILFGKPDVTMALNGTLAGLVGITANCDRVSQGESLTIGLVAGVLVVLGIMLLDRLKIDDPVGAWPVHGLCGVWGGLATGIFGDLPDGIESQGEFFFVQLKSTVIICVWAFVTMFILFSILKAIGILRVSAAEEQQGLDLTEHGMKAYAGS
ncbi:MAG: ammonium transporter [Planctomycetes bacterium]|nr:ammonium transporter [Planctomycetota bacterium]